MVLLSPGELRRLESVLHVRWALLRVLWEVREGAAGWPRGLEQMSPPTPSCRQRRGCGPSPGLGGSSRGQLGVRGPWLPDGQFQVLWRQAKTRDHRVQVCCELPCRPRTLAWRLSFP